MQNKTPSALPKKSRVNKPIVSNENARMIASRNPILSANAPVNDGKKYIPAENAPLIHADQISLNPTTRER
jgi:hypothetical protein